MGLDDTIYGTIRSNILAHDPLPNLNKVYSILIQEEQVQTMARGKEDKGEVMAFVVRGRVDGKDKTMICSHCKRSGHDVNSCFALIGYLKWWGDRPRTNGKNEGRGRRSQSSLQHGKDKTMIFSNCKRSGMTQILALHSLDTLIGGVIDRTLMERMETVVLCGSMQVRPYLEAQP